MYWLKFLIYKKYITKKKAEVSHTAIKDISFNLKKGEFIGLMGPSGSGKTTLLNLIATLDSPSSGEIIIDGIDISTLSLRQLEEFRSKTLGFVFQEDDLLNTLTIYENIMFPLYLQGYRQRFIEDRVLNISKELSIESFLYKYPSEISGGERQRVAVARALIHNPPLILADEPTGALDTKNAKQLLLLFSQINKTRQASMLLVTHDARSASYCDRVLFIEDGQIFKEIKKSILQKNFILEY